MREVDDAHRAREVVDEHGLLGIAQVEHPESEVARCEEHVAQVRREDQALDLVGEGLALVEPARGRGVGDVGDA